MTSIHDDDIRWLYGAGRSVDFIAKHTGLHRHTIRRRLGRMNLVELDIGIKSMSTMSESTHVPRGDPLLESLRKHHPERDPMYAFMSKLEIDRCLEQKSTTGLMKK